MEALNKGLRVRMVSLHRAQKLAYPHDIFRFLRKVRLTFHSARRFIQRFHIYFMIPLVNNITWAHFRKK